MGRNEEELKMPAPQPLPPMEVHPVPILSVLPPNIPQQDFLARAIAALETPLGVKRDLRFIMERYHNFVAANSVTKIDNSGPRQEGNFSVYMTDKDLHSSITLLTSWHKTIATVISESIC